MKKILDIKYLIILFEIFNLFSILEFNKFISVKLVEHFIGINPPWSESINIPCLIFKVIDNSVISDIIRSKYPKFEIILRLLNFSHFILPNSLGLTSKSSLFIKTI